MVLKWCNVIKSNFCISLDLRPLLSYFKSMILNKAISLYDRISTLVKQNVHEINAVLLLNSKVIHEINIVLYVYK